MKYFEYILGSIIVIGCFCSCETTDSNGNTTRFDTECAIKGIGAAVNTWQQIDRQTHIVGYDQFGNPVYK